MKGHSKVSISTISTNSIKIPQRRLASFCWMKAELSQLLMADDIQRLRGQLTASIRIRFEMLKRVSHTFFLSEVMYDL